MSLVIQLDFESPLSVKIDLILLVPQQCDFIYLFSFFDFVHARSRVKRFMSSSYIYHEIFLFGKQKKKGKSLIAKRKQPIQWHTITGSNTLKPKFYKNILLSNYDLMK